MQPYHNLVFRIAKARPVRLVNTIPLTVVTSIDPAGISAKNIGSALIFFGLYFCVKKYGKVGEMFTE